MSHNKTKPQVRQLMELIVDESGAPVVHMNCPETELLRIATIYIANHMDEQDPEALLLITNILCSVIALDDTKSIENRIKEFMKICIDKYRKAYSDLKKENIKHNIS